MYIYVQKFIYMCVPIGACVCVSALSRARSRPALIQQTAGTCQQAEAASTEPQVPQVPGPQRLQPAQLSEVSTCGPEDFLIFFLRAP